MQIGISSEKKSKDPMTKVRLLLKSCNHQSWRAFIPGQGISIDESMCPYKGRFAYKQYIASKRNKFGIKLWVMCDGATGYILKNDVYTGSWTEYEQDENSESLASGNVVKNLSEGLSQTGSIIFTDSFYTAVDVADHLSKRGMGMVGTLRLNRVGIPNNLRYKGARNFPAKEKGDPVYWLRKLEKNPYPLVCIGWWDKKPIGFLSTVYSSRYVSKPVKDKDPNHRLTKMPEMVLEYNYYMGGIDLSDQRRKSYAFPHPGKKWYLHMYHYLVESCLNNSLITFNDLRIHMREKVDALRFRWELIEGMLKLADMLERQNIRELDETPEDSYASRETARQKKSTSERLTGRHFAEKIKAGWGGRCVVCSARRKKRQVEFICADCGVHLCPEECFKIFHTVEHYESTATM